MLSTDPSARRIPPGRITGAKPPSRGKSRIEPTSPRFVLGTALGVGVVSFLASELMHYILVPDLGRHRERLLAEALSALIVSCLAARLGANYPRTAASHHGTDAGDCGNESS